MERTTCDDLSPVDTEIDKKKSRDLGMYKWVVVASCTFAHIIIGAFERSDGVLYLKLLSRFESSATATAWVGAMCSTLQLVLGPAASALSNKFSVRLAVMAGGICMSTGVLLCCFAPNLQFLYFSYGTVIGIGSGLAYTPGLVLVSQYFDQNRGRALGLSTAGNGMGTFIVPPLVDFLFWEYGYFGAFLILSCLPLHLCICAALYRPISLHRKIQRLHRRKQLPTDTYHLNLLNGETTTDDIWTEEKQPTGDESRETLSKMPCSQQATKPNSNKPKFLEISLLKHPSFLLFCISICLFTAFNKAGFTFLPALAKSRNLTELHAALLLSVYGISDTIGRIAAGFVLDLPILTKMKIPIYILVIFLIGVISFSCPVMSTFEAFAAVCALYGVLTGAYVSQKCVIIVDILGPDKLSSSVGIMIFFQGVGTFVGPPLSGFLKDTFGRYDEAFFLAGGMIFTAGLVMIASYLCMTKGCSRQKG